MPKGASTFFRKALNRVHLGFQPRRYAQSIGRLDLFTIFAWRHNGDSLVSRPVSRLGTTSDACLDNCNNCINLVVLLRRLENKKSICAVSDTGSWVKSFLSVDILDVRAGGSDVD